MNLHAIVGPIVSVVNPTQTVSVQVSIGRSVAADGREVPQYLPAVDVEAQVQPMTYHDITQTDGLNLNGTRRAIYMYGRVDGLVRALNKGGDLITTSDGSVWLVAMVLEQWQDVALSRQPDGSSRGSVSESWCKVAVTLQNQVPTSADFTDPRNSGAVNP